SLLGVGRGGCRPSASGRGRGGGVTAGPDGPALLPQGPGRVRQVAVEPGFLPGQVLGVRLDLEPGLADPLGRPREGVLPGPRRTPRPPGGAPRRGPRARRPPTP